MLTAAGKLLYLNGGDVVPVKIVAHSAATDATGSTNRIGALKACTFGAATTDNRKLTADVAITVPAGVTSATHFSIYNATDVCLHISPLATARSGLLENDTLTLKSTGSDAVTISIS